MCSGTFPVSLVFIKLMALSMAASALFDLGDKASWITTEDSGIRASGS